MALRGLNCAYNAIDDLSPLAGMSLEHVSCDWNRIATLEPLRGMPLRMLCCTGNRIADLTPLEGMPLFDLHCSHNTITDLSPLRGMPLITLYCQHNAITELSPLAGSPLERLNCGGNPIVSLLPLQGMEMHELAIEHIPLEGDNAHVLRQLSLQHLICDFVPAALALLRGHATLQGMNHHTVAYLREMGESVQAALREWREGKGPGNRTLHAAATACGQARFLSVPVRMTRPQAESFSRYCGGTLVCPATAEILQQLLEYLATVIYPSSDLSYHLGLTLDPATGELRWLSGAPYRWQKWQYPDMAIHDNPTGIPCLLGPTLEASFWSWDADPEACYYFIIEWQQEPNHPTPEQPGPQRALASIPDLRTSVEQLSMATHQETQQVSTSVQRLLLACTIPATRKSLMAALGLRDLASFRRLYLLPALQAGYLERTIPDKPNSSHQQYRLTAQGRAVLAEVRQAEPTQAIE